MEADVSHDFEDYWNEYKTIFSEDIEPRKSSDEENTQPSEVTKGDQKSEEEGNSEAEWLVLAGLPHLTNAYLNGEEIGESQVESALNGLSMRQAHAVRKRINSLNQTVKHRCLKNKYKKPDIRDVFKNTPPAIVSETSENIHEIRFACSVVSRRDDVSDGQKWGNHFKETLLSGSTSLPSVIPAIPVTKQKIKFCKNGKLEKDVVASSNDGITMLAFQRFGTMREKIPSNVADVMDENEESGKISEKMSKETSNVGFEQMCQQQTDENAVDSNDELERIAGRTFIDTLGEDDFTKLRPLLFVELSAIFDDNDPSPSKPFPKMKVRRKAGHRRKMKRDGNIFGVSLERLIEKDANFLPLKMEQNYGGIPLIFRKVLKELEGRGLKEEGVLRLAGNKMKTDALCQFVDKNFYENLQETDQWLERASVRDLSSLFKKLLRDLPEPLLTTDFVNLFYQSAVLRESCFLALNLLALLLPATNRCLLFRILSLGVKIAENEHATKMTAHNVAMILAPSILPPRYIHVEKGETTALHSEIGLAATSCRIVECMMNRHERLNIVPSSLVSQLRCINEINYYGLKENNLKGKGKKLVSKGHFHHYYAKKGGDAAIVRKITNEVDYQGGIVRVSAPQFNVSHMPFALEDDTTAGDIVLKISEIGSKQSSRLITIRGGGEMGEKQQRGNGNGGKSVGNGIAPLMVGVVSSNKRLDLKKQRVLTDLAPNGNLSCLLATADADTAIATHFLYEIGGNIGQRRVEASATMIAVYQMNPNAEWVIKCDHQNAKAASNGGHFLQYL